MAPAQPVPLAANHPHIGYAAAQLGSLPHPSSGADWQYAGSLPTADGYRHSFRHPAHPLTGRPEQRWVPSTAADVATYQAVQQRGQP